MKKQDYHKKSFEIEFLDNGTAVAKLDGEGIETDLVEIETSGPTKVVRIRQSYVVDELKIIGENKTERLTVETKYCGPKGYTKIYPTSFD